MGGASGETQSEVSEEEINGGYVHKVWSEDWSDVILILSTVDSWSVRGRE